MVYVHHVISSLLLFFAISLSAMNNSIQDIIQLQEITLLFDRKDYNLDDEIVCFCRNEILPLDDREYKKIMFLTKLESNISAIVEAIKQVMKEEDWRLVSTWRRHFWENYINRNLLRIKDRLNLLDEAAQSKLSFSPSQEMIDLIREDGYLNLYEYLFREKNCERIFYDDTLIDEVEIVFENIGEENEKECKTIIFLNTARFDVASLAEDITNIIIKQNIWTFKSFSHRICLGKDGEQQALRIQKKLDSLDQIKDAAVLIIID